MLLLKADNRRTANSTARQGLYRVGTFVDRSFEEFLHAKLSRDYPEIYQERHLVRGMKDLTTSTKLQFSNSDRQSNYLQLSDDEELCQGCVELRW